MTSLSGRRTRFTLKGSVSRDLWSCLDTNELFWALPKTCCVHHSRFLNVSVGLYFRATYIPDCRTSRSVDTETLKVFPIQIRMPTLFIKEQPKFGLKYFLGIYTVHLNLRESCLTQHGDSIHIHKRLGFSKTFVGKKSVGMPWVIVFHFYWIWREHGPQGADPHPPPPPPPL